MDNQQAINISWYHPIPFAKEYLISEDGFVLSRRTRKKMTFSEVTGYNRVPLVHDGVKKHYLVHRLVAITFLSNPLNKEQVNHKDGNKKNNHFSNLEWCTREENMQHAFATGLNSNKGEMNGKCSLTEEQVLAIYQDCLSGLSNRAIASKYGTNTNVVNLIKTRRSWGYLTDKLPQVKISSRSPQVTYDQKVKVALMRQEGISSSRISKTLGINLNQVENLTKSKCKDILKLQRLSKPRQ